MLAKRLIARLDVKFPNLIKTVRLEGLKVVGDPGKYAARYNFFGIDEILFLDIVASLYGRNHLADLVERTTEEAFCPVTVGGGVRCVEDVKILLRAGADKIALNTAATENPALITELAEKFGSQCVVLQIDAKKTGQSWEAWKNGGREPTGLDAVSWAKRGVELGAGEILLTSIDREGTQKGFDLELIRAVRASVPVVASGGMGVAEHAIQAIEAGADGVAAAHVLHHGILSIDKIKKGMSSAGYHVRCETESSASPAPHGTG